jgi:hypothetical protein
MPKEINKMRNKLKWRKEMFDFKYVEPNATIIAFEKKKEEERQFILKQKDDLWNRYFGFDGTCLEHDILQCRECRVPATGRCYSSLEE